MFPQYDINYDDEVSQYAWDDTLTQDPILGSMHTEALFVWGDEDQDLDLASYRPEPVTTMSLDALSDLVLLAVEDQSATEAGTEARRQADEALARAWENLDIAGVLLAVAA